MTVTTTETRVLSRGSNGYLGYIVHTTSRPHDMRYGISSYLEGQLSVLIEKTTVSDGCFIPGQYRVNPYTVKGGNVKVSDLERNASYKDEFFGDYFTCPGIPQYYLDMVTKDTPIYYAAVPFVNTYWTSYGGFIPGNTYCQVVWIFGDWWRYALPAKADAENPPRKAADFEQLSLQKVYGKLRKADLEFGEVIGEYRETIGMLRSPLKALRDFLFKDKKRNLLLLKALAKRDRKGVNRLLGKTGNASFDAMSSTWLELRYGFRPLVMLIQDVIERVQDKKKQILDPDKIRSVRSRLKFGPYQNWVQPEIGYGNVPYVRSRILVEDTYYSVASVQYKQKSLQSFLDTLGLTPRFLPETAWELTKCSFVWDWLFTIGPWLATLRINPDIEVLGNTSGFRHNRTIKVLSSDICTKNTYPNVPWTTLGPVHDSIDMDSGVFETNTYDRKVDLDLSYRPHFTWGRTLDLYKAIDALALLWQFTAKK